MAAPLERPVTLLTPAQYCYITGVLPLHAVPLTPRYWPPILPDNGGRNVAVSIVTDNRHGNQMWSTLRCHHGVHVERPNHTLVTRGSEIDVPPSPAAPAFPSPRGGGGGGGICIACTYLCRV